MKRLEKIVTINGNIYAIKILHDGSCDEFDYYIEDDLGRFCTRVSNETIKNWDNIVPKHFDNAGEFVEFFGDAVQLIVDDVNNYEELIKEYGEEWVIIICGVIVVMKE